MSAEKRRYKSAAPRLGQRRRSAMGEYIPPPGERPLSSIALPTPSPFDYNPRTEGVFPSSPSHSLHSRPFPLSQAVTPGPSEYPTRRSSVWKHKTFTLSRKGLTRPYDPRENAHITCSPGAGHYHSVGRDVGSANHPRSLSARHREGIHVGPPNSLVLPVDTMGFTTPGPNLWRESERGQKVSFNTHTPCPEPKGQVLKKKFAPHSRNCPTTLAWTDDTTPEPDPGGPGPAAVNVRLPPTPSSPGKTMGLKLNADFDPGYPAPNNYTIPSSLSPRPQSGKTFGIKNDIDTDQHFPSPDTYKISRPSSVKHSFTYRPFPTPGKKGPGPAEYSKTDSDLQAAPNYSCRNKCRPVFPDILLYPECVPEETPGAGDYEYDREFANNSAPRYSHGLPLPIRPNSNPGPNRYKVRHDLTQSRVPSYTAAPRRPDYNHSSDGPGPANYHPKPRPKSAVSITPRRTRDKRSEGPGPNQYSVRSSITRHGRSSSHVTTLKGRRSTACYSGFPSSHLMRLSSIAS